MSPRFSVIIPTLNEAAALPATISAAQAAFGDDAEFIVVDGGSTDTTCEMAAATGARVLHEAAGRGIQLHAGFSVARGEICLFVHADTLVPPGAAAALDHAMLDPHVSGGAFLVEFGAHGTLPIGLVLWKHAMNARSRMFRMATGDQVIFARRAVLAAMGGVPRVPLFEDVRLCTGLKRRGRFVILRERVHTSPRLWTTMGLGRGIALHLSLRLLHALGAQPETLVRRYPAPRL